MATTITTDNVKTIYALDAVTSLADTDDLIVWDSTNSAHKKITRADLQTDIASRSESNLDTLAAITTAGTVLPDGKAVGQLSTYKIVNFGYNNSADLDNIAYSFIIMKLTSSISGTPGGFIILQIVPIGTTGYKAQLAFEYSANAVYTRHRNGDTNTWSDWFQL